MDYFLFASSFNVFIYYRGDCHRANQKAKQVNKYLKKMRFDKTRNIEVFSSEVCTKIFFFFIKNSINYKGQNFHSS